MHIIAQRCTISYFIGDLIKNFIKNFESQIFFVTIILKAYDSDSKFCKQILNMIKFNQLKQQITSLCPDKSHLSDTLFFGCGQGLDFK